MRALVELSVTQPLQKPSAMPRRANVHAGAGAGAGAGNDGGLGAELEYENDDGLTEFDRQVLTIIEQYPNVRACRGVVAASVASAAVLCPDQNVTPSCDACCSGLPQLRSAK